MEELTIKMLNYRELFTKDKRMKVTEHLMESLNLVYMNLLDIDYKYDPLISLDLFESLKLWSKNNVIDTRESNIRHQNLKDDNIIYTEESDQIYFIGWHRAWAERHNRDEAILLMQNNPYIWKHMEFEDTPNLRLDILLECWNIATDENSDKLEKIVKCILDNKPIIQWKDLISKF
jgi:hypothetical protein